jgi:hypothetical protein
VQAFRGHLCHQTSAQQPLIRPSLHNNPRLLVSYRTRRKPQPPPPCQGHHPSSLQHADPTLRLLPHARSMSAFDFSAPGALCLPHLDPNRVAMPRTSPAKLRSVSVPLPAVQDTVTPTLTIPFPSVSRNAAVEATPTQHELPHTAAERTESAAAAHTVSTDVLPCLGEPGAVAS